MLSVFCAEVRYGLALAFFSISGGVFWPYFFGAAILVIGLAMAAKNEVRQARGFDILILFGPLLFAIPMAIFGADHLTAAKFIAMIIPSWIPGHLFWAYFVGVAMISAALSLATGIQWRLAALLLGIMIFLFVLMLHIPALFSLTHDKTRLTIALRDLALSGGALALATSSTELGHAHRTARSFQTLRIPTLNPKLSSVTRFFVAIPIVIFGIDHFLYPTFAPGIPQENGAVFVTMPAWIPGHAFWAYLVGTTFVACGLGIIVGKHARSAAMILGATVLVLVVFVYVPLTVAKASDIANGLNYLAIHLALAGAALLLAGSLSPPASNAEGKLDASLPQQS
jgi:uncharacterized membrane protein YphA (DoxX/SURF4 family)